jgi:hypothetical protein
VWVVVLQKLCEAYSLIEGPRVFGCLAGYLPFVVLSCFFEGEQKQLCTVPFFCLSFLYAEATDVEVVLLFLYAEYANDLAVVNEDVGFVFARLFSFVIEDYAQLLAFLVLVESSVTCSKVLFAVAFSDASYFR